MVVAYATSAFLFFTPYSHFFPISFGQNTEKSYICTQELNKRLLI